MAPYRKMIGEKVFLSPMSPEDTALFTRWLNDPEVTPYLNAYAQVIDEVGEEAWIKANASRHIYRIILKDDERTIGNVGLENLNELHKTAEIGVFIGEKGLLGTGVGHRSHGTAPGIRFFHSGPAIGDAPCISLESPGGSLLPETGVPERRAITERSAALWTNLG